MTGLTPLEAAVLEKLIECRPDIADAVREQVRGVRVIERENTGVGFVTLFGVEPGVPRLVSSRPIGDVIARIEGMEHGLGFALDLKKGRINGLDAFSLGADSTEALNPFELRFTLEYSPT